MDAKLSYRQDGFVIGDSVTFIGQYAFQFNSLISIVIGANVELGDGAFSNGFEIIYNDNGRMAGTYTRPDTGSTIWNRD